MKALRISVAPPTPETRLSVRYDRESDILTASSASTRKWLHGIDVDGNLIFDLDQDRRLLNLDLHIPMSRWNRTTIARWPEAVRSGSLAFAPSTVAHKSFTLPLQVNYDQRVGVIAMQIGQPKVCEVAIGLSRDCVALAAHDELLGFVFRFDPS